MTFRRTDPLLVMVVAAVRSYLSFFPIACATSRRQDVLGALSRVAQWQSSGLLIRWLGVRVPSLEQRRFVATTRMSDILSGVLHEFVCMCCPQRVPHVDGL